MFPLLALLASLLPLVVARPPVEFLQPRARVVLAGVQGSEVPIQIRIEPHPDNRGYVITWCGMGSSGHTLDGENDAAVHPIAPLLVRVYPGSCELTAIVFGPGDTVRARASFPLLVCGDEDHPCNHP